MFRTTIFVVALLIASTVSLFYFINYGNGPSLSLAYQGLLRYSAGNTSTFAAAPNTWVRDYFAERAPMRASLLSFVPENTFATLYNVLEPEYYIQSCSAVLINHFYALCPNLVRVGNLNDGGKFVCNPRMLPMGNCSIYSLGIREDISFEQDLQAFNNHACALYGYDKDPSKHETISAYERINGKVMTLCIASISRPDEDEYTLDDLAKKNGDNSTSIEILKMDIEGGEHSALIPFLRKYRVCQLLLEIHGDPIMHVQLLHEISLLNYALFSYEVNGDSLTACEYSFIHLQCMEKYGAFILKLYLKDIQLLRFYKPASRSFGIASYWPCARSIGDNRWGAWSSYVSRSVDELVSVLHQIATRARL